ncbi:MAG: hypothetical protein RL472_1294, partial [Pseudomonadota bacterium]
MRDRHLMAHRRQFCPHLFGITAFDLKSLTARETAWGVDGFLRIKSEIHHIGDKARMAAGLIGPAHDAKGHGDAAILF